MPATRPTLARIAAEAGLSKAAVSNILAGRNKEGWAGTRERAERVRAIAGRLGWRPNAASKAVSTGRFDAIGLVWRVRDYYGAMPGSLLDGIAATVAEHDRHLVVARLADDLLEEAGTVPKPLRELMTDGLLMSCIEAIPEAAVALIRRHRIPAIWLNARLAEDCVHPDDHGACAEAGRRLLALGHRRIAYAHFRPSFHYSAIDRAAGVASALKSAGLTLRAGRCELAADGRVAWAQALLAAPDRPTAVLCYSTDDALPLLLAARTLGLAVPRDLSLVAVHDRPFTASGQDLTRLHLAFTEVGRIGVERLLARIAHPRTRLAPVAVPCPWYEGTTCAPPPSR